jgi:hypothetical protein
MIDMAACQHKVAIKKFKLANEKDSHTFIFLPSGIFLRFCTILLEYRQR